jgi:hypothetical protein
MRISLEHRLPRRLRYAKLYFEAGSAKMFFSLDGDNANWQASIGRPRRDAVGLSDKEYSRLRASTPAVEMIDDNGQMFVIRDSEGYEERWMKPAWGFAGARKIQTTAKPSEDEKSEN